mmetsp:Transcript_12816/g.10951  ORF Transcript_12816/g.10951 Transcript_12816/m.10951 type:complete len:138 (+) Transcript_12816:91-504(+)
MANYIKNRESYFPKPKPKINKEASSGGFFSSIFPSGSGMVKEELEPAQKPLKPNLPYIKKIPGLYVYGNPGTGKTFLMDLFYNTIPFQQKQRIHFNEFMLKVHASLHKIDQKVYTEPLRIVAEDVAVNTRLLCFDEF